MRAACNDAYGPPEVVKVTSVDKPAPGDDEILVKVAYSAVTAADSRIRGARFPKGFAAFARLGLGLTRPRNRILGSCFSGVVEDVGANVTEFEPGDEVSGMNGARMRAHAEYVVVKAGRSVVRKPDLVSHSDAAGVVFGGLSALNFLRDRAHVRPGQNVLVVGASGAVGSSCVQLAKHFGATVTGVTSTKNVELVSALGADRVVDYEREDVLALAPEFDLVVDTVGVLRIGQATSLLTENGKAALVAADLFQNLSPSKRVLTGLAPEKAEDIALLLALVASGELKVVVERTYTLDEVVDAHRRADSGHKVGNILLRLAGE